MSQVDFYNPAHVVCQRLLSEIFTNKAFFVFYNGTVL